jgi:hypothetical protein
MTIELPAKTPTSCQHMQRNKQITKILISSQQVTNTDDDKLGT